MFARRVLFALLALLLATPALAQDRRVALVIGNAAYRHAPALANPVNDAEGVAAALRGIGFQVTLQRNLGLVEMRRALRDFGDAARGADVALLFFAGHGMQLGRRDRAENFLVPVDARLTDARDVEDETLALSRVLEWLEGAENRILILDACRDNPLAQQMASTSGTRSVGRGLAPIEGAGRGTLVAFSTDPGATAADGAGRNSPFTAALLEHLPTPGLEIRGALTRVRQQVVTTTQGRQTPWANDGLLQEVFLAGRPAPARPAAPAPVPAVASVPVPAVSVPQVGPNMLDLTFWQSIQTSRNTADFEAYLAQFPQGTFAALARNRIAELRPPPAAQPVALTAPAAPPTALPSPPPRALERPELVEAQRLLTALGFNTGGADGVVGPRSRAALRGFAAAVALPEDTDFTADVLPRLRETEASLRALLARGASSPRGVAATAAPEASDRYARAWAAERASPPDHREALYWYGLAAQGGDPAAFVQLGLMLVRGLGLSAPDPAGGALLWRLAAGRGDAAAAFNLGTMHERGLGVPADRAEARRWYTLAANGGNAGARDALRRVGP